MADLDTSDNPASRPVVELQPSSLSPRYRPPTPQQTA